MVKREAQESHINSSRNGKSTGNPYRKQRIGLLGFPVGTGTLGPSGQLLGLVLGGKGEQEATDWEKKKSPFGLLSPFFKATFFFSILKF